MCCFITISCESRFSYSERGNQTECIIDGAKSLIKTWHPETKSCQEDTVFFKRNHFFPLWDEAVLSETNDRFYLDVPVLQEERFFMVFFDGLYYRLSESHYSLTFIMEKGSQTLHCYNHFFLPEMNSGNWPGHFEGQLYSGYYGLGGRSDYSGLEVYSNLEGQIISFDIYQRGKQINHFYACADEESNRKINEYFELFTKCAFKESKTKTSPFICPVCGADFFWEDPYLGYICTQCGYFAFYEGEIDESQIIGEYTGGGSSGGGNDFPDDPEGGSNPDPGQGPGGEGGGTGGNGSGAGGGSSGQNNIEYLKSKFAADTSILIWFPSNMQPEDVSGYLANLISTLNTMFANTTIHSIIEALSQIQITLIYDSTISYNALTNRQAGTITWKVSSIATMAEEFFHIYQYQNLSFRSRSDCYYEFEAKCFLVAVLGTTTLTNNEGNGYLWNSAQAFLLNPSEQTFNTLKGALSFYGGYDVSQLYYLPDNMIPNLQALDIEE